MNFVNKGTDEAILKSLPADACSEELIKAMGRQGLVQKDVTVRGKNGQTFTRKQWVRASEDATTDKTKKAAPDEKKDVKTAKKQDTNHVTGKNMDELCSNLKSAGYEMDSADRHSPQDKVTLYKNKQEFTATFNKYSDGGVEVINIKPTAASSGGSEGDNSSNNKSSGKPDQKFWTTKAENPKQSLTQMLQSGMSRNDIMAAAKENGVTWKENAHEGINWMRASMAIQKHIGNGGASAEQNTAKDATQGTDKAAQKSSKPAQDNTKSDDTTKEKSFDNGTIDKDGELVGLNGDKDYLGDLVEEITGKDMFDVKDMAQENLEAYLSDNEECTIESLGIESAKYDENKGVINVKCRVEGYVHTQSDDGSGDDESLDRYVDIKIPYTDSEFAGEHFSKWKNLSNSCKKVNENIQGEPGDLQNDKFLSNKNAIKAAMFVHDMADVNDIDKTNRRLKEMADDLGITENGGTLTMDKKGNVFCTLKSGESKKVYRSHPDGTGFIFNDSAEDGFFSSRGVDFDGKTVKTERRKLMFNDNGTVKTHFQMTKVADPIQNYFNTGSANRWLKVSKTIPAEDSITYNGDVSHNGKSYTTFYNSNNGKFILVEDSKSSK